MKWSLKTLQRGNISVDSKRKRRSQAVEKTGHICEALRQKRTWSFRNISGGVCEEGRMPYMKLEIWAGPKHAGPTGCFKMFWFSTKYNGKLLVVLSKSGMSQFIFLN